MGSMARGRRLRAAVFLAGVRMPGMPLQGVLV